jgi:hypothetical protein
LSGQDNISTIEHISRFLAQCGEAAAEDALRVRLFPLSLFGSAFTWLVSLPNNSIRSLADLEKQFHKYFFVGLHEMRLADLIAIKQRDDELVPDYIQRFRDVRSRCFSLNLTDGQLEELGFQGLLPAIKDRYSAQEFESLGYFIQRVSAHESHYQDSRGGRYQKKVSCVGSLESDSKEDNEVGLAKWTRNKKAVSCPWVKASMEKYNFNVNKADQIFDFLLREK